MSAYAFKPGPRSSHGCLLQFLKTLPRNVQILDVGAAEGYFGAALRREGFTSLYGVEKNTALAAQAEAHYKRLSQCDLEADPLPYPEASFDVIICADILEHLNDPGRALVKLAGLMAPSGWMLVSLPNVAHWSVRLSLLAGRFEYAANGLLDETHLRFYTLASARHLIASASLKIRRQEATPLPIARWYQDSQWAFPLRLAEWMDWRLARLRPQLFAYQNVFFVQR